MAPGAAKAKQAPSLGTQSNNNFDKFDQFMQKQIEMDNSNVSTSTVKKTMRHTGDPSNKPEKRNKSVNPNLRSRYTD